MTDAQDHSGDERLGSDAAFESPDGDDDTQSEPLDATRLSPYAMGALIVGLFGFWQLPTFGFLFGRGWSIAYGVRTARCEARTESIDAIVEICERSPTVPFPQPISP